MKQYSIAPKTTSKNGVPTLIVLLLFLVTAFVFPACQPIGSNDTGYTDSSTFETGELRELRNTGHYTEDMPWSVDTYLLSERAYLLLYNDYKTMQQQPLCSKPGCAHIDDACDAYIAEDDYIHFVHVTSDKVILQRQYDDVNKQDFFSLQVKDIYGGGWQELVHIDEKLVAYGQYITDDKALFMQMGNGGEEAISVDGFELMPGESALVRIDLTTGELSKLLDLSDRILMGLDGDDLLFWNYTTDDTGIASYSLKQGEQNDLPTPPEEIADLSTASTYNGVIYFINSSDSSGSKLLGYSPISGEYPLEVELKGDEPTIVGIIDNYALIQIAGSSEEMLSWVYVDLASGELVEVPFVVNYEGRSTIAEITGVYEGDYVFISGNLTYYDASNDTEKSLSRNSYSKLTTQSFWNATGEPMPMSLWAPNALLEDEEV